MTYKTIRLSGNRRGSVLILVIVLVVLLALMGTALLSTTRSDRAVSSQNIANTQVDLLMDGVQQMVKGTITHDNWGHFDNATGGIKYDGFRLPEDSWAFSTGTFTSRNWDAPQLSDPTQIDLTLPPTKIAPNEPEVLLDFAGRNRMLQIASNSWLSPRLPRIWMNNATLTNSSDVAIGWSALSRLPGVDHFDTPFAVAGNTTHIGPPDITLPLSYTQRLSGAINNSTTSLRFVPNYVQLTSSGLTYPAWYLPPSTSPVAAAHYVLAGDADGDGVADSGLVKIGEYDGVTYYYCTRIVDNNSAININTAWSQTSDFNFTYLPVDGLGQALTGTFTTAGAGDLGMFKSHVGLTELLFPTALPLPKEPQAMFEHRANYPLNGSSIPTNDPYDDAATPAAFGGFKFNTIGEQWESQLARRLDNPGYHNGSPPLRMQRFGLSDGASLAYHGIFNNMDVSLSPLEAAFRDYPNTGTLDSMYAGTAPNRVPPTGSPWPTPNAKNRRSYPVASGRKAIERWFDDNFYFEGDPGAATISPVTSDPNGAFAVNLTLDPFGSGQTNGFENRWRSPRSILVTENPVSNLIAKRYVDPTLANPLLPVLEPTASTPGMPKYRPNATYPNGAAAKTNINTACFDELWRAFWCVMAENSGTGSPFNTAVDPVGNTDGVFYGMEFDALTRDASYAGSPVLHNPQRMFRSNLRDFRTWPLADPCYFTTTDMVKFRAAAAAVQTIQMRDTATPLTGPTPQYKKAIPLDIHQGAGTIPAMVHIWGTTPQPFITEVFVWNASKFKKASSGEIVDNLGTPFVAIELYNPYSTPIALDSTWHIVTANRSGIVYGTPQTLTNLADFGSLGTPSIPAGGYLLLMNITNKDKMPDSALFNPVAGTQIIPVGNLGQIIGNEMSIIQEMSPNAMTTTQADIRPIDSYDFTGLAHQAWHYARPCGGERRWQCVYPGRYVGNKPVAGIDFYRHQGTDWADLHIDPAEGFEIDDWQAGDPNPLRDVTLGTDNVLGTMPATIAIQLNNTDFPGPNRITGATGNKYPFGGFMRNGDILQVPFIAACTIVNAGGQLIDMNSVSMDSSFAEDSDPDDDYAKFSPSDPLPIDPDFLAQREQVGRFCPIRIRLEGFPPNGANAQTPIDDYNDGGTYTIPAPVPSQPKWHYRWAMDLFDYLCVESPGSDYLPNVPPVVYTSPTPIASPIAPAGLPLPAVDNDGDGTAAEVYVPPGVTVAPMPVQANVGKEDTVGSQGLININTAPWKVLAQIPWLPRNSDVFAFEQVTSGALNGMWVFDFKGPGSGNGIPDNEDIARAIVYWRDGDPSRPNAPAGGPFRSIFDLYKVHLPANGRETFFVFNEVQRGLMTANIAQPPDKDLDDTDGDFSPLGLGTPAPGDLLRDHSHYDFEEMYLTMTKVSNLITTRSDSFTVYIQLQGWRGVGGTNPQMVVQRRSAFIQDRSQMTETNKTLPPAVNVANE